MRSLLIATAVSCVEIVQAQPNSLGQGFSVAQLDLLNVPSWLNTQGHSILGTSFKCNVVTTPVHVVENSLTETNTLQSFARSSGVDVSATVSADAKMYSASATISHAFQSESSLSDAAYFVSIDSVNKHSHHSFDPQQNCFEKRDAYNAALVSDLERLPEEISDPSNLQSWKAYTDFFSVWKSHVAISVTTGAKYSFRTSVLTADESTKQSAKTKVCASAGGFGIKAEGCGGTSSSSSSVTGDSKINRWTLAQGGSVVLSAQLATSDSSGPNNALLAKFLTSADDTTAIEVQFQPIYEVLQNLVYTDQHQAQAHQQRLKNMQACYEAVQSSLMLPAPTCNEANTNYVGEPTSSGSVIDSVSSGDACLRHCMANSQCEFWTLKEDHTCNLFKSMPRQPGAYRGRFYQPWLTISAGPKECGTRAEEGYRMIQQVTPPYFEVVPCSYPQATSTDCSRCSQAFPSIKLNSVGSHWTGPFSEFCQAYEKAGCEQWESCTGCGPSNNFASCTECPTGFYLRTYNTLWSYGKDCRCFSQEQAAESLSFSVETCKISSWADYFPGRAGSSPSPSPVISVSGDGRQLRGAQ